MYKVVSTICVVIALAVGGLWVAKGMHLATPEEIQKEVVSKDEFGDEVKKVEWVANPDKLDIGLDLAGPIGGGLFGLGVVIFVVGRRKES